MKRLEIIFHLCNTQSLRQYIVGVRVMVFNATFNSISVVSQRSVLLGEETGVTDKLTTLVVIGTDCTDSCKSNYHPITTTTTRQYMRK